MRKSLIWALTTSAITMLIVAEIGIGLAAAPLSLQIKNNSSTHEAQQENIQQIGPTWTPIPPTPYSSPSPTPGPFANNQFNGVFNCGGLGQCGTWQVTWDDTWSPDPSYEGNGDYTFWTVLSNSVFTVAIIGEQDSPLDIGQQSGNVPWNFQRYCLKVASDSFDAIDDEDADSLKVLPDSNGQELKGVVNVPNEDSRHQRTWAVYQAGDRILYIGAHTSSAFYAEYDVISDTYPITQFVCSIAFTDSGVDAFNQNVDALVKLMDAIVVNP